MRYENREPRYWLKKMREERGLSHGEIGDLCGMNKGTYYRIESGQVASPRFETAKKIADKLGFDVQRFYQD